MIIKEIILLLKDDYNNSPSFNPNYSLKNDILISKKFYKSVLGDSQ